jgi:site-specific DNA-cytosine methylase
MKPLAIDLFCGLGGWTDGLIAEGYDVVGFDIEKHVYGEARYPAQLVIQDVLTLHGSQFKDAALIVASPPCQRYSWMAQPWSIAKREASWQRWERTAPIWRGLPEKRASAMIAKIPLDLSRHIAQVYKPYRAATA